MSYTLKENLIKLDEIRKFEKDWNGYNADPISPIAVDRAEQILVELDKAKLPQPFVAPTVANTIQLEWEKEDGLYLEINVDAKDEDGYEIFLNQYCDYFDESDYEMTGHVRALPECINNLIKKCFI